MKFPGKKVLPRYTLVGVILCLVGLSVLARAAYVIFAEGDLWKEASKHFIKTDRELPATRGNILADDGQVLAASLPQYKMYMDFMSWEKKSIARRDKEQHLRDSVLLAELPAISEGLHRLFPDVSAADFAAHIREGRRQKSHHWLLYPRRVTYIQYRAVKELPVFCLSAGRGGFHVEEFKTRKNPFGSLAARTIGDLYKGKDSARSGLELSCDSILRGTPGRYRRQKVRGRFLRFVEQPAVDGLDVQTTLNVSMQDICEKALKDQLQALNAKMGVCILMEVATGDIKAITSLSRQSDDTYRETWPYAVNGLFEPGSVFKPMSFMVALEDGCISTSDQVDVGRGVYKMHGRDMKDHNWRNGKGYGVLTVPQILQKSSNVGVSVLIDKHYYEQPEKFVDGLYRLGVAEDLKLPVPGYAKPKIRRPLPDGSNWSKTALAWMSIGYETQMPPISTLNFYNGVANGGKLLRPRLVKAILKDGQPVKEFPVVVLRERMAKPEVVKQMQDMLESVVSVGLGKKAGSPLFHVSGKTGTAQIWAGGRFSSEYLVSFAGYFPSEKPRYSCIVCIQKSAPASGGLQCGPVFRRVAETVMAQQLNTDIASARDTVNPLPPAVSAGNLMASAALLDELGAAYEADFRPEANALLWGVAEETPGGLRFKAEAAEQGTVPDVRGYGLRDAVFRLEKLGLKVKATGVGRVKQQSLAPGRRFRRGESVELVLDMPRRQKPHASSPQPPASSSEPRQQAASATAPAGNAAAQEGGAKKPQGGNANGNKTKKTN